jgi:hypothetical protein
MGAPPMDTLPARLESDGSGLQTVIGSGDSTIRLPLNASDASLVPFRDAAVVLGIRPDCIAEPQRGFGAENTPAVTIDAVVEMTEPTGAETILGKPSRSRGSSVMWSKRSPSSPRWRCLRDVAPGRRAGDRSRRLRYKVVSGCH